MSRRGSGQGLLSLLLLAAGAVLGARLYDEWRQPGSRPDDAAFAAESETAAAPPAPELTLALPPPDEFAVIAARPLFSPTRRPAPPAPAEPEAAPETDLAQVPEPELVTEAEPAEEAAPPPTVTFTLVGIVIDGSERYALVEKHADGKVVRLTEGDAIEGWFAVLIDPERAVFRQGAIEEELVLKYDTPVPPERMPAMQELVTPARQPPAEPEAPAAAPEQQAPQQTLPWKQQNQ
jgi:hypothetical protein